MATLLIAPPEAWEQRVVMHNVSWETYEGLLAANADASSPRLTYHHGTLEIMSPSFQHERLTRTLAAIAQLVAEEIGAEFDDVGSTTFRRREFKAGAEPDSCFYLQNADRIRGKPEIDLAVDPPPDLVIEVEITSPAVSKLPIYARFGVPEIWLTDGRQVRILRLAGEQYEASDSSGSLPPLSGAALSELLEQRKTLSMLAWRRLVRNWARERRPQASQ